MDYMSAKEAADKWGISQRRVAVLCSEQRIDYATRLGNMWLIPKDAKKPSDLRSSRKLSVNYKAPKPFLKWAGGNTQLLSEISKYYPFDSHKITKYAEPFVGGGAVLFDILSKYKLSEVYISDTNLELINAYTAVRDYVDELIYRLEIMQTEYESLDYEDRKIYYYDKREVFNELKAKPCRSDSLGRAALLIFLNRTCFNGLYRVNKKNMFNVPMGRYKNPMICDRDNLKSVSAKLKNVIIVCADFHTSDSFIDDNTFVYFDPPYRPLTESSSFTAYNDFVFDDEAQLSLARFADVVNGKGAKFLISNSDPKNINEDDDFFDEIYSAYNIKRLDASRSINSDGAKRGKIRELLISNF